MVGQARTILITAIIHAARCVWEEEGEERGVQLEKEMIRGGGRRVSCTRRAEELQ